MFLARAYTTAIIARHIRNAEVIVSGGQRGMILAGFQGLTEAGRGAKLVELYGIEKRRIWLETSAVESIGNLLFLRSFFNRKTIRDMLIITEASHGERLMPIARHLYPHLRVGTFNVPSPPEVDLIRAGNDNSSEAIEFSDRFVEEVPRGNCEAALLWIQTNHNSHPYFEVESLDEMELSILG